MNSSSSYILSKSITELNRLKPRNNYIRLNTKNNFNNLQKSQLRTKNYLTINLDQTTSKDKDVVLLSSICKKLKKGKRKILKKIYSKDNCRNQINTGNENKEKQNKTSLFKHQTTFNDKNLLKNNEYQSIKSFNRNANYKNLNYSNINRCYTENNYNFLNNKIIIPIYQGIFDNYKLNKVKSNSNNNSSIKHKKRK